MQNFFILLLFFAPLALGCGSNGNARNPGKAPVSGNGSGTDATSDDAVTQDFPTPGGNTSTPTTTDGGKKDKKDPKGGGGPGGGGAPAGGGSGGGAQNCNAVFEDGYWKTWPKDQSKPALPPSGPAPANSCKETTSSDTTGGSTNGQSAGNQRVLLKTADGCYVPNGGGPVGPLLGACTGLTWRVPY